MRNRLACIGFSLLTIFVIGAAASAGPPKDKSAPAKVYVPYDKLRTVFPAGKEGVFLPYKDFQALWRRAQGSPADAGGVAVPYLISTARFSGKVGKDLARMHMELTIDILADGWVEVPIGLGKIAVDKASFAKADKKKPAAKPLLRVVKGKYILLTKGKGRRVLKIDFVRQLVSKPGLHVLNYDMPAAAISTLDLLIPEENMKVDVEPMLAATTSQVEIDGKKATKLQAFLGASRAVKLSWKPRSQAAADLTPVVVSEQLQAVHVTEALVQYNVKFTYNISRRGVENFTIQLPGAFRVTAVTGANIAKWSIAGGQQKAETNENTGKPQTLTVKLFSPAKDKYALNVKMERFIKGEKASISLWPVRTQKVLRMTGLVAVSHSHRRSVKPQNLRNIARVDLGQLPKNLRGRQGVTAWRFNTADYSGGIAVGTVAPRISLRQNFAVGVRTDMLNLYGEMNYNVERTGVFRLSMNFPEPWEITSLGDPGSRSRVSGIVEDFQLVGKGADRKLKILLRHEKTGQFRICLHARQNRLAPDAEVSFTLPAADKKNLRQYSGQLVLCMEERFRAEVAGTPQFQPIPLNKVNWGVRLGVARKMAFAFRTPDRAKPAGATFKISVKPTQISAMVHRLVDIKPGSITHSAFIAYNIRYAPVDTLYLKLPASLADESLQITGDNIKEKPRIEKLPADQQPTKITKSDKTTKPAKAAKPDEKPDTTKWAYYKIVLQSPVIGRYNLFVTTRQPFRLAGEGEKATVTVPPILAAGKISDQSGTIAIAKSDTLAIFEPKTENLLPADPSSPTDLSYAPYRQRATMAFKYNKPPFTLSFTVVQQAEASVITMLASGAIIEQVIGRDGVLNTHATFLLQTRRGDRLPVTLPDGAKIFAVLINGTEAPIEAGQSANQRIVRLPSTAGQVAKIVLEISYSLQDASTSALPAPKLPDSVPVQQTLWRLWVHEDDTTLAFDSDFSRLGEWQSDSMLHRLGRGFPVQVAWKLPADGRQLNFLRQGAPNTLSVTTMHRETFSIVIWAVIIVVGVALLKLNIFMRCMIVLAGGLGMAVTALFASPAIRTIVRVGLPAAGLILLLWILYAIFTLRKNRLAEARQPAVTPIDTPPIPATPPAEPADDSPEIADEKFAETADTAASPPAEDESAGDSDDESADESEKE